jgi:hypothetical protein
VLRVAVALSCVGAGIAVVPGSALATLWVSSSGTDTGYGSQANSPLTIQCAGLTATTVSGGFDGSGSVFTIQDGASATINDVAITGGVAVNGGGVNPVGALTMSRDLVAYNSAIGPHIPGQYAGFGGGVSTYQESTIQDRVIAYNRAVDAGGGIASYRTTVTRSLVDKNTVGGGGAGGGLWMQYGVLSDSTITANRVQSSTGGQPARPCTSRRERCR